MPARTKINKKKELAFIGLGRMGAAMTAHLVSDGYTVHGYDVSKVAREAAAKNDVTVHTTLAKCVGELTTPRVVWVMVPSKFVDDVLDDLIKLLQSGDCIIDGGNSFFKESIMRQQRLEDRGVDFIDAGVSGGVGGARCGASLMVGGEVDVVRAHEHLFCSLAEEDGYGYVGGPGAGHFVKMVHNGIEYGMMGAISEGVNVLDEHKDGMHLNIKEALKAYEHGSIIESNLISWLADAYESPGDLERIAGEVPHGETEMEMEYLIKHNQLRVLSAALTQRKLTRVEPSFIGTLIAAIRNEFGGHTIISKKDSTNVHKEEKKS